jgi:hypothetical protein
MVPAPLPWNQQFCNFAGEIEAGLALRAAIHCRFRQAP